MEIVNLVGGDRRPPEQRQSYMRERTVLGSPCGPVFALHQSVIRGRAAERDAIPVVICPHAGEGAASGDKALEVVNVRRLQIRSGRLIVAAIFVEPRDWVWLGAAI